LPDLGDYPRDRVFRSDICVFLDLRLLNKPEVFANAFPAGSWTGIWLMTSSAA
jgi:hypothetical protein